MHSAREAGQERIEGPEVATEETAYERGRGRGVAEDDGIGVSIGGAVLVGIGVHPAGARHDMSIPVRKDDDVTRGHLDLLLAGKPPEAAPRE